MSPTCSTVEVFTKSAAFLDSIVISAVQVCCQAPTKLFSFGIHLFVLFYERKNLLCISNMAAVKMVPISVLRRRLLPLKNLGEKISTTQEILLQTSFGI